MTQRERKLTLILLATLGGVGGLLVFMKAFVDPLKERNQAIAKLRQDADEKELDLLRKRQAKKELARLRVLSLPADPDPQHQKSDLAWDEYEKYLWDLLRSNRLKVVYVRGTKPAPKAAPVRGTNPRKQKIYTALTFNVEATGSLSSLVTLLEKFYETPLLHQIKSLTIKPVTSKDGRTRPNTRDLAITMAVEALLIDGAEARRYLLPHAAVEKGEGALQRTLALNGLLALRQGPAGLPLVPWTVDASRLLRPRPLIPLATPGQYAFIGRKSIFFEPAPPPSKTPNPYPDENRNNHIRLTSIVHSGDDWEAFVYNVFRNVDARLQAKDKRVLWTERHEMVRWYRTFVAYDNLGEKTTARVYRIDTHDVYFLMEGEYYSLHIGEQISDALRRPELTDSQIAELGLPPKEEEEKKKKEDE
jgi:hypothetical protein